MDDERLAPEGGEPEAAAETESQPAPEGEAAPEQQQPEPDPFAGIDYVKVRERFADKIEEEASQRERLGFSRGQGESRKEFSAWQRKFEGEIADQGVFERLEAMRISEDPEQQQAFSREMANPATRDSYGRGQRLRRQPAGEELERIKMELGADIIGGFVADMEARPELQNLSDEERKRIDKANFKTVSELGIEMFKLGVERGVAAGKVKEDSKVVKEAVEKAVEKVRAEYREAGVEGPGEIEGTPGAGDEADAILASSTATGEQKAKAFEEKFGYKPRGM